jgi:hypothetical protein
MLTASTGFMLGMLFNPGDGGNMFLQNVALSLNYTMLQPLQCIVTSMIYLHIKFHMVSPYSSLDKSKDKENVRMTAIFFM